MLEELEENLENTDSTYQKAVQKISLPMMVEYSGDELTVMIEHIPCDNKIYYFASVIRR
jgi:hypothetical protein